VDDAAARLARLQSDAALHEYDISLWDAYDKLHPEHLYRYTSLTALRGILGAKSMWATDVRYMNDFSEGNYAWTVVATALRKRDDFLSVAVRDTFEPSGGIPGFGTEWFRYAVCFCSARDLLSQWISYTPRGAGVAMGLQFGALLPYAGKEFALVRVLYDEQEQVNMVYRLIDSALDVWHDSPPSGQAEAEDLLGALGIS
jgi:hypothetical protein